MSKIAVFWEVPANNLIYILPSKSLSSREFDNSKRQKNGGGGGGWSLLRPPLGDTYNQLDPFIFEISRTRGFTIEYLFINYS